MNYCAIVFECTAKYRPIWLGCMVRIEDRLISLKHQFNEGLAHAILYRKSIQEKISILYPTRLTN